MKITVGRFLEQGIENGTITENQRVFYYDKNNIGWVGKATYAPLYLDHVELTNHQKCGVSIRTYPYQGGCSECPFAPYNLFI